MAKPSVPGWTADARFWLTVFVIAFWPAVIFGHMVGLVILLAVVVVGAYTASQLVRRSRTGDAAGPTARR
jgi:hypothetical protein